MIRKILKEKNKESGIYTIKVNGEIVYIGSTVDFERIIELKNYGRMFTKEELMAMEFALITVMKPKLNTNGVNCSFWTSRDYIL